MCLVNLQIHMHLLKVHVIIIYMGEFVQVDAQALSAQLVVLTVTASTALYWWYSVVPSARRTLAKEKRSGPLSEYLQDLQQNPNKPLEQWFYTDWLRQLERRQQMAKAAAAKRATAGSAGPDTNLQQQAAIQGQTEMLPQQGQRGPVLQNDSAEVSSKREDIASAEAEDDKQPLFWSLDNPILATAAMLTAAALVSSILRF
jgi:hypothetical protein